MSAFDPAGITAAILAGGEGRRIGGEDKGLRLLAGRPLIVHVLAALRGQAGAIVICANRNADRYAKFAPVIADDLPGFRGPLAGVAAALGACKGEWLLTVPVDCPRPPHDLARRLHAAAHESRATVVVAGSKREPLFALYPRGMDASAAAAAARGLGVWRWQGEIRAVETDFSDRAGCFVNLNTPDEFRQWEQGAND